MITMTVCPMMYCGVPKNRAARSAPRPKESSPNAPRGRATSPRLEERSDELVNRPLALRHVLAQELVELDPDEQDDRTDVQIRRQDEEHGEAPRSRLEVRDRGDVEAEDQRLDEPRHDDEHGSAAGPAFRARLGGGEPNEQPEGEPEQQDRPDPAQEGEGQTPAAVNRVPQADDEEEGAGERG